MPGAQGLPLFMPGGACTFLGRAAQFGGAGQKTQRTAAYLTWI